MESLGRVRVCLPEETAEFTVIQIANLSKTLGLEWMFDASDYELVLEQMKAASIRQKCGFTQAFEKDMVIFTLNPPKKQSATE